METIDLSNKSSSELEDMSREWSDKILKAENSLQIFEARNSRVKKISINLSDNIKKARHIIKRLEREKADIKSAMFRKLREGI